jgi:hypothetical protein
MEKIEAKIIFLLKIDFEFLMLNKLLMLMIPVLARRHDEAIR